MNRGGVCARSLNIELQAALNLLHGKSAWPTSHDVAAGVSWRKEPWWRLRRPALLSHGIYSIIAEIAW